MSEDNRKFKVIREAEVLAGNADMIKAEATSVGEHEELAEAGDGIGKLGVEGMMLSFDLEKSTAAEAAPEYALDGVLIDFKDKGEFKDEGTSLVLLEAKATS